LHQKSTLRIGNVDEDLHGIRTLDVLWWEYVHTAQYRFHNHKKFSRIHKPLLVAIKFWPPIGYHPGNSLYAQFLTSITTGSDDQLIYVQMVRWWTDIKIA
jgi:hypothetical protein